MPTTPQVDRPVRVPFSFADDQLNRTQAVSVALGGFDYPGEVIVGSEWQKEFGEPISGISMFRLVLLRTSTTPTPDDITDSRIVVAAYRTNSNRIRESEATYTLNIGSNGSSDERSAESDIRSLRAVRRNYISTNDPGLGRLASALATYETQVNEKMARKSHEKWKSGVIVISADRNGPDVRPAELFLLSDPESWIESAAATLDRIRITSGLALPEQIFEDLQCGRLASARDRLRQICKIRLGELTPTDHIATLVECSITEGSRGEIAGDRLVQLLIHQLDLPPAIASLWLISYALDHGGELEFKGTDNQCEYLSEDTISEIENDSDLPNLIVNITLLRTEKSDSWDAVLPFLKLVSTLANFTAYGGGRTSDIAEVEAQLDAIYTRVKQASPVMLQLEVAAGATRRPLTSGTNGLMKVLRVGSWSEYISRAREIFGSVGALRSALIDASHQWAAIEYAPDIEKTIYYLDQVEFGRVDHSLAIERRMLRSRFDLKQLLENRNSWLSLRDEFERWRQEYRRTYLQDHAERRESDQELHEQILNTTRRIAQIQQFDQISVLRGISEGSPDSSTNSVKDIPEKWERLTGSFRICESDGSDIRLIDEPVCPECHGRLGQGLSHTDISNLIVEVDRTFASYRDRLALVVSRLVLKSENSDKLQKLFRLNSAGDLSDLANVLDDKVISFLNELFGKTSGNHNDWTSPHS